MRTLKIDTARVFLPLLAQSRYKAAWGGRGCVAKGTLIDTPHGQVKIEDFTGGYVWSYQDGRRVKALATAGAEYFETDLFEVQLKNGASIVVTDEHRFLTARGWVPLASLSMSDEVVTERRKVASSPLRSISGICSSMFWQGVRHSIQIAEGLSGRYSEYHHQCGQPLLLGAGSVQVCAPSQGDALRRSCRAPFRADALGCGDKGIPSWILSRLSIRGGFPCAVGKSCEVSETDSGETLSGWPLDSFPNWPLSRENTNRRAPLKGWLGRFAGLSRLKRLEGSPQKGPGIGSCGSSAFSKLDFTVSGIRVVSKHSRQTFWDLHVFGTNNYLSNGIVNHNSGKSHFFAEQTIEDALRWPGDAGEGLRQLEIREVQKSLKQSSKFLIESKLAKFGLGEADGFKVFVDRLATPGDGVIEFQGMQDHTADTIKSYEGFHKARVEEAQTLSATSLTLLRPTIRWEDLARGMASELSFSWNPRRKSDPVDAMFRAGLSPTGSVVVRANWSDNPWFPAVLEQERLDCLAKEPDQYEHIWEGGYATALTGAYYAKPLLEARTDGRIGHVAKDPLMTVRAIWDIGGTGAKADACSIWICQFIGKEIRFLDYYEAQGQPLAVHVAWLRANGWGDALCVLPHDGSSNDKVFDVSYESALRQAGFDVLVVPNQGKGAAMMRVEAARRLFPSMWFNEPKTGPGLDALGWYHEKKDVDRNIGLGPDHDWSSHCADAFGLAAVVYEAPVKKRADPRGRVIEGAWMG